MIGGYEETHVMSDSLISSEGGVLVESLKQFAAGKLGSDWGWSIDLTCFVVNLFFSALKQCSSARARCHQEVLVSVSRQAGALLALRRLPLEQQKRGVRQARAAGILQVHHYTIGRNFGGDLVLLLSLYVRGSIRVYEACARLTIHHTYLRRQ